MDQIDKISLDATYSAMQTRPVARLRREMDHVVDADLLLVSPGAFGGLLASLQKVGGRQQVIKHRAGPEWRTSGRRAKGVDDGIPEQVFFEVTDSGSTICDANP